MTTDHQRAARSGPTHGANTKGQPPTSKRAARAWFGWALGLLVLVLIELMSLASAKILENAMPWAFWSPAAPPEQAQVEDYLAQRHPELGWPSPTRLADRSEFDPDGARRNPHFDPSEAACISTYGDSFTWSDEVTYEHAWPTFLSSSVGCPVANYGVWGYGIDQAVLRHELNTADRAPLTILTIVPYNTYRNLNQMRSLIAGSNSPLSLKPRFVLDEGRLRLVPLPDLSADQVAELSRAPHAHLDDETYLPGTRYGPIETGFPYTRLWLQIATNGSLTSRLAQMVSAEPHWAGFYRPEHPTGSMELMLALVRRFAETAESRGQEPFIVMLPDNTSVDYFRSSGTWEYDAFLESVEEAGFDFANAGPEILDRLGDQSFCSLLKNPGACSGHFNEDGYAFYAGVVKALITQHLGQDALRVAQVNAAKQPPRRPLRGS